MAGEIADNQGRGGVPWTLPPIHPEGRRLGLIPAALGVLAILFGWSVLGVLLLIASLAIFAFFRDPARVVPQDDSVILAPADGIVTQIVREVPAEELRIADGSDIEGLTDAPVIRVSIFLSMFDVHINRAPIGGILRRLIYLPGSFASAELDKASKENERQYYLIERPDGVKVGLTQVAGLIARRLVSFAKVGDTMAAGQRFGMIRFGSRVDVWLPDGTDAQVLLGQRCIAGETVIGRLKQQRLIEGVRQ